MDKNEHLGALDIGVDLLKNGDQEGHSRRGLHDDIVSLDDRDNGALQDGRQT